MYEHLDPLCEQGVQKVPVVVCPGLGFIKNVAKISRIAFERSFVINFGHNYDKFRRFDSESDVTFRINRKFLKTYRKVKRYCKMVSQFRLLEIIEKGSEVSRLL